jgi:hypothetical protein
LSTMQRSDSYLTVSREKHQFAPHRIFVSAWFVGKPEEWLPVPIWTITPFTRWDEKAGLRGMRYAPNVSTCSRHNKKETGDEED